MSRPHKFSPQPSVDPRRERSERCVIDTRTARAVRHAVRHAVKLTRVLEERRFPRRLHNHVVGTAGKGKGKRERPAVRRQQNDYEEGVSILSCCS